ncbi:MAG: helix-turn-helix domain-containing protein [Candidatus Odinarchaeota archaeon]
MAATRSTQQTRHGAQKGKNRPSSTTVQTTVPSNSKENIIDLLREKGALTRGDITTKTGIPRTTVYDTLMNLLISGVIEKYVEKNGRRGRPSVYYQLV